MDCFAPLRRDGRSNLLATARCGSLLLSFSADVRTSDDVIGFKGHARLALVCREKTGPQPATSKKAPMLTNGTSFQPRLFKAGGLSASAKIPLSNQESARGH